MVGMRWEGRWRAGRAQAALLSASARACRRRSSRRRRQQRQRRASAAGIDGMLTPGPWASAGAWSQQTCASFLPSPVTKAHAKRSRTQEAASEHWPRGPSVLHMRMQCRHACCERPAHCCSQKSRAAAIDVVGAPRTILAQLPGSKSRVLETLCTGLEAVDRLGDAALALLPRLFSRWSVPFGCT